MLLVVTYSQAARTTLRDIYRTYDEVIVRQLGRTAPFGETELVAFLALRLRGKHDEDVQIEQTQPLNRFAAIPDVVRKTAAVCEDRESPTTPYSKFTSEAGHPSAAEVQRHEL